MSVSIPNIRQDRVNVSELPGNYKSAITENITVHVYRTYNNDRRLFYMKISMHINIFVIALLLLEA